ncbi:neuraminidase-like domain-containing protein [Xanthomonas sp. WHRI 1810A]|uniref:Tc toxin subunit A-related protein n=1 Tax=Xanthomonas sp. WHRI 1810A TaxID=3161565 RepID=UPI0032E8650B
MFRSDMYQQHRDALVAYYLGQLVPSPEYPAPENIVTPEDLYEYLLIDNQVSAEVDTSRVAQGIASIQQHVHAIYNGMEPGFEEIPDLAEHTRRRQLWREGMSEYSTWAGYQMLADYPENYLDPSLRLGKTEAFKALEGDLSQARLTTDTVQKALGNYLTLFEEVSNLNTVACYIDGVDFCRSDYYFIGRQTVEPFAFYWRKAAIDLDGSSPVVPPSAWTEWKKIETQTSGKITHIRPVIVEGRLHVVWLEQLREELDANEQPKEDSFIYRLNVSYLQSNGQWSAAINLIEHPMPSVETIEADDYGLCAFADYSSSVYGPRLVIAFVKRTVALVQGYAFVLVKDRYWNSVYRFPQVLAAVVRQLGISSARAQMVMEVADTDGQIWALESVEWAPTGDNYSGPLSPYLEVEVKVRQIDETWGIEAVGICDKPWYGTNALQPATLSFAVWNYSGEMSSSLTLNGRARTKIKRNSWPGQENTMTVHFGMKSTTSGLGYKEFTITRKERSDAMPTVVTTADGSQFIDLECLLVPSLRYVRLNTAFAGELVRRAEVSVEAALGWEAQHMLEGAAPNNQPQPVDFDGANGRYFWELFFHLPHLVASRLHQSFDYAGAEQWLHYLFNPQARVAPLHPAPALVDWLPYWTSRPLAFADDPSRDTAAPRDPDTIAYGAPSHYRKAIFMLYVDNLIAWGDSLYRQVTRDTLNEAQLHYVRALSLLGPLSKGRSISQWAPQTLAEAARHEDDALAAFEVSTAASLEHATCASLGAESWIRLIDAPWFRLPVNTRLLDLWDQMDARLYNLRNNLTLDGRPMKLALYEAPANPRDLLRAQLAGSSAAVRRLGALAIIAPYRFSAMLMRARSAVDTLMAFGNQLQAHMENRDRAEQQSLQQAHLLELTQFVETFDTQAIEQAELNLAALKSRREQLKAKVASYDQWLEQDVSDAELAAEQMLAGASASRMVAAGLRSAGSALSALPNTITLICAPVPIPVPGGWTWGGPPWAAASLLEGSAIFFSDSAEAQLRADARERRRTEWAFLKDEAQKQVEALALQDELQQMLIRSAQLKRDRSRKYSEAAQALYAFIQNRATNAALYQWLGGQMATLYFQAYDAVFSLCLATEACWQYEIGDGDTRFIPVNAWQDNRHGLTAGESLGLGLMQMESAFLVRNERSLDLAKTVSLRRLLADYQTDENEAGWPSVIAQLRTSGTLDFALKPSLFDRDYPGHYLRQLEQVTLSLPGVLGPFENARAVLGQLTNSYLLKADLGGCKHMYQQANELPGEHDDVNPRFVIANPRSGQQIAISGDTEDSGLHTPLAGDERYLPFEGTGAVSSWTLTFARHESVTQQRMFDDLQDIIIHLRYRAMDGGKVFAQQVKALLPPAEQRRLAATLAASL